MRIWWVLGWDRYYPSEGLKNVVKTFATEEEAIEFANRIRKEGNQIQYEYKGKSIEYTATYDVVEIVNVSEML